MSTLRTLSLVYSLVIDPFTLLDIEGASNGKIKPREHNVAAQKLANPKMGRDICKICDIIKQIQVGRAVMFCSKVNTM